MEPAGGSQRSGPRFRVATDLPPSSFSLVSVALPPHTGAAPVMPLPARGGGARSRQRARARQPAQPAAAATARGSPADTATTTAPSNRNHRLTTHTARKSGGEGSQGGMAGHLIPAQRQGRCRAARGNATQTQGAPGVGSIVAPHLHGPGSVKRKYRGSGKCRYIHQPKIPPGTNRPKPPARSSRPHNGSCTHTNRVAPCASIKLWGPGTIAGHTGRGGWHRPGASSTYRRRPGPG